MAELVLIVAAIVVLSALLGFAGIVPPLKGLWGWLLLLVGLAMALIALLAT